MLVIVASVLTLLQDYPSLVIGRFIYGLAAGAYSVYVPKYISEVSPVEVSGTTGSLTQFGICFGILVADVAGIVFPVSTTHEKTVFINCMFAFPIVLSVINIVLLMFVFPYDTPVMLKQKNEHETLKKLMSKIYKPEYVQDKMNAIHVESDHGNQGGVSEVTYREVFFGKYRKATWIGLMLSVQQ